MKGRQTRKKNPNKYMQEIRRINHDAKLREEIRRITDEIIRLVRDQHHD